MYQKHEQSREKKGNIWKIFKCGREAEYKEIYRERIQLTKIIGKNERQEEIGVTYQKEESKLV